MQITFNTNELSATDVAILNVLTGGEATPLGTVAPKAAPKAAPAPAKAAPAKAAPKAEPVVEEEETPTSEEAGDTGDADLLGDQPTMADAVSAATQLVSSGGAAKVKEALAEVGAKRVSEMKTEDIPAFLAALSA